MCLCNRSKPIKRKKKNAVLSHRNRDGAHIALLFAFQQLKQLKTHSHATDVVSRLVLVVLHLLLSPLHAPWWRVKIAVIQMMKKYRKLCILLPLIEFNCFNANANNANANMSELNYIRRVRLEAALQKPSALYSSRHSSGGPFIFIIT